ncbi:hypothetical protein VTK26DRAFT_2423 [Humicola hyalothermophila]
MKESFSKEETRTLRLCPTIQTASSVAPWHRGNKRILRPRQMGPTAAGQGFKVHRASRIKSLFSSKWLKEEERIPVAAVSEAPQPNGRDPGFSKTLGMPGREVRLPERISPTRVRIPQNSPIVSRTVLRAPCCTTPKFLATPENFFTQTLFITSYVTQASDSSLGHRQAGQNCVCATALSNQKDSIKPREQMKGHIRPTIVSSVLAPSVPLRQPRKCCVVYTTEEFHRDQLATR